MDLRLFNTARLGAFQVGQRKDGLAATALSSRGWLLLHDPWQSGASVSEGWWVANRTVPTNDCAHFCAQCALVLVCIQETTNSNSHLKWARQS